MPDTDTDTLASAPLASLASPAPEFDGAAVRAHFPSLALEQDGHPVVFADNPGGTQVVRECIDADLLGKRLVNEAMGTGKPFAPRGATVSEIQAWANLFRGTVGAFKNPQSHRDVKLCIEDAAAQLLTVNLLIRKLKADFPKKFKTKDERHSMTRLRKAPHAQTP